MIGLVNAVGTPEASRNQSKSRADFEDANKKSEHLVSSDEQAVERVLNVAVETIQLATPDEERGLPKGDESDRFAQADAEAKTAPTPLGGNLDVQA
jgi:hypothetical protein